MASVSTSSTDLGVNGGPRWSLRNRLMSLAAAGTLVAWVMGGSVVYFVAAKESHDLFDERLRRMGAVVLSFASTRSTKSRLKVATWFTSRPN